MRKLLFQILIFILISGNVVSQNCNCIEDIKFLTNAYKKDYSGIKEFINAHPYYYKTIDSLIQASIQINDIKVCENLIARFIKYMENGHVMFGMTRENPYYQKRNRSQPQSPEVHYQDSMYFILTIPTADLHYKSQLDSIMIMHKNILEKTEHFVLDLRGNGGGGDAMFKSLIPYLYTHPIVIHRAELWTSENNVRMFEELLSNPDIPSESKKEIRAIVDKAKKYPNEFILLSNNRVDTLILDSVYLYPKKVSILINSECKSATEQFLLLAKQSKKVTIYGTENSGGALDYSNLRTVFLPSGYWYVTVPTTRSTRLPNNPVDPIGINPDVIVNKNIDPMDLIIKQHITKNKAN